mmetsp:Transcript_20533/g.52738  ORF Transcript_20533/g.52738 Transcript_20533/m.52738 type:complete len:220 (+) Transcript_20533:183-842(+)
MGRGGATTPSTRYIPPLEKDRGVEEDQNHHCKALLLFLYPLFSPRDHPKHRGKEQVGRERLEYVITSLFFFSTLPWRKNGGFERHVTIRCTPPLFAAFFPHLSTPLPFCSRVQRPSKLPLLYAAQQKDARQAYPSPAHTPLWLTLSTFISTPPLSLKQGGQKAVKLCKRPHHRYENSDQPHVARNREKEHPPFYHVLRYRPEAQLAFPQVLEGALHPFG